MMRRLLILLWFVIFSYSLTPGQLVQFDFNNSADPLYKDNSISIADIGLSSGSFSFSSAGSYFINEPYIQESGGWSKTSYSSGKSFNVLLTGTEFSVKAIRFRAYSTSAGPSALTITVNGDVVKTIDMPASTLIEVEEFVSGYNDINSAVIKLVGWDNGSRSTSGGGILKIDDLEISNIGEEIIDSDTELKITQGFVAPAEIIPNNSDVDIFSFIVSDKGTADMKPTVIKSFDLRFVSAYEAGKIIDNIRLYANGSYVDATVTISDDKVNFVIPEPYMVVADGDDITLTVKVTLKNGDLFDGMLFRFVINDVNSFKETDNSSLVGGLPDSGIEYGSSTINVVGNGAVINEYPEAVGLNSPFNITLINEDNYGNRDSDAGNFDITVETGNGLLSYDPNSTDFSNGLISVNNVTLDKVGYYSLLFRSGGNKSVIEPLFVGDKSSVFMISEAPQSRTVVYNGDGISAFRFVINDRGDTDNLPTKVKQFYINRLTGDYDLRDIIKEAELYTNDDRKIEAKTVVETSKIKIYLPEDALNIDNGASKEITVKLRLKDKVDDGVWIQIKIDDRYFGGKTYSNSSLFVDDIGDDIISDKTTIDIVADRLHIDRLRRYMPYNYKSRIRVVATDRFGNRDKDATGVINFESVKGSVNFSSVTDNMVNGISESVYIVTGESDLNWQIEASSDNYVSAQSDIVYTGRMVKHLKYSDFENDDIESTDWKSSVVGSISGDKSLKHNIIMSDGRSSITLMPETIYTNRGSCNISYNVKVGNWSINNDNCFYTIFYTAKGRYILGVNYTGADDNLKLWYQDNSRSVSTLMDSDFKIDINSVYSISVGTSSDGLWSIYAGSDDTGNGDELIGTVDLKDISVIDSVGFTFRYTESSGGSLWIDDIDIMMFDKPSFIESYSYKADNLVVMFNEHVVDNSLHVTINQDGNSSSDIDFSCVKEREKSLSYISTDGCKPGSLDVNMIFKDMGGNISDSTITLFKYDKPLFSDVVFSEIHHSPKTGDKEFIELYNTSAHSFIAEDCLLISGNDTVKLPEQILLPDKYLLLVSESSADWATEYSPLWLLSSLPSLSSEADSIKLVCYNKLIDVIKYNGDWADREDYKGRSLERINLYNRTNTDDNWTASVNDNGHSAGADNSVMGDYKDAQVPEFTGYSITDEKSVTLYLSESVNDTIIFSDILFPKEPLYISEVLLSDYYDRLTIRLNEEIQDGVFYKICFNEVLRDLQNNYMSATDTLTIFKSSMPVEGDIIINEVLFNPYSGQADFIEIKNVSDKVFELDKFRVRYYKEDVSKESTVDFGLSRRYIKPNSYFVISTDILSVRSRYKTGLPDSFGEVKRLQNFSDDNGVIELLNIDGDIIDRLTYDKSMHYKFLADQNGVSLERIDANRPADATDNWHSASETSGFATPALPNSHQADVISKGSDIVTIDNRRFSPDNDGYEDRLVISYNTDTPGWRVYGEVLDIDGHNIADVFDGVTLSESGNLYWNGVADDMSRVKSGIYFFHFKLFDENGSRKVVNIPFLVVYPVR
ncbi:MAG: lamin tail domain-containing protein [Bacteroidales bacterium]|jgi:hypothetical protein|nr:lamin tail domain-containing protein [Bacteroidales bacterium]